MSRMPTFTSSNNAYAFLAQALTADADVIVTTGGPFSQPGPNQYMVATLSVPSAPPNTVSTAREIIHAYTSDGVTFSNVLRGQEGTTPQAWPPGTQVEELQTSGQMNSLVQTTRLMEPPVFATSGGAYGNYNIGEAVVVSDNNKYGHFTRGDYRQSDGLRGYCQYLADSHGSATEDGLYISALIDGPGKIILTGVLADPIGSPGYPYSATFPFPVQVSSLVFSDNSAVTITVTGDMVDSLGVHHPGTVSSFHLAAIGKAFSGPKFITIDNLVADRASISEVMLGIRGAVSDQVFRATYNGSEFIGVKHLVDSNTSIPQGTEFAYQSGVSFLQDESVAVFMVINDNVDPTVLSTYRFWNPVPTDETKWTPRTRVKFRVAGSGDPYTNELPDGRPTFYTQGKLRGDGSLWNMWEVLSPIGGLRQSTVYSGTSINGGEEWDCTKVIDMARVLADRSLIFGEVPAVPATVVTNSSIVNKTITLTGAVLLLPGQHITVASSTNGLNGIYTVSSTIVSGTTLVTVVETVPVNGGDGLVTASAALDIDGNYTAKLVIGQKFPVGGTAFQTALVNINVIGSDALLNTITLAGDQTLILKANYQFVVSGSSNGLNGAYNAATGVPDVLVGGNTVLTLSLKTPVPVTGGTGVANGPTIVSFDGVYTNNRTYTHTVVTIVNLLPVVTTRTIVEVPEVIPLGTFPSGRVSLCGVIALDQTLNTVTLGGDHFTTNISEFQRLEINDLMSLVGTPGFFNDGLYKVLGLAPDLTGLNTVVTLLQPLVSASSGGWVQNSYVGEFGIAWLDDLSAVAIARTVFSGHSLGDQFRTVDGGLTFDYMGRVNRNLEAAMCEPFLICTEVGGRQVIQFYYQNRTGLGIDGTANPYGICYRTADAIAAINTNIMWSPERCITSRTKPLKVKGRGQVLMPDTNQNSGHCDGFTLTQGVTELMFTVGYSGSHAIIYCCPIRPEYEQYVGGRILIERVAWDISLPGANYRFGRMVGSFSVIQLEARMVVQANNTIFGFRLSTNFGQTFLAGSGDYENYNGYPTAGNQVTMNLHTTPFNAGDVVFIQATMQHCNDPSRSNILVSSGSKLGQSVPGAPDGSNVISRQVVPGATTNLQLVGGVSGQPAALVGVAELYGRAGWFGEFG